jgi:hypothetical protein
MNQDEFNEDERRSKQRIEAVYQELQRHREKVLKHTWVGLTNDDRIEALKIVDPQTQRLPLAFNLYAAAIEAKLKEKNT